MTHDAIARTEATPKQRRSTRKTRDIRGVTALEKQCFARNSIQMGTHRTAVAVASKVIGTERVDVDVDKVHRVKNAITLRVLRSCASNVCCFSHEPQKQPELLWILLRRNTAVSDISAHSIAAWVFATVHSRLASGEAAL